MLNRFVRSRNSFAVENYVKHSGQVTRKNKKVPVNFDRCFIEYGLFCRQKPLTKVACLSSTVARQSCSWDSKWDILAIGWPVSARRDDEAHKKTVLE